MYNKSKQSILPNCIPIAELGNSFSTFFNSKILKIGLRNNLDLASSSTSSPIHGNFDFKLNFESFILSILDYCNAFFININDYQIDKLQKLQTVFPFLVFKAKFSNLIPH